MKAIPLFLTVGSAMLFQVHDTAQSRTIILKGEHGTSVITQSGDPAEGEIRIERSPGKTTIYSRSGNNSSVVTQSDDPADLPLDRLPPNWRDLFGGR